VPIQVTQGLGLVGRGSEASLQVLMQGSYSSL